MASVLSRGTELLRGVYGGVRRYVVAKTLSVLLLAAACALVLVVFGVFVMLPATALNELGVDDQLVETLMVGATIVVTLGLAGVAWYITIEYY